MKNRSNYLPLTVRIRDQCPTRFIRICLVVFFVSLVLILALWSQCRDDTTVTLSPETDPDYHRLINITFNFKLLPKVCDNLQSKFIVAVHTAPKNFERRKALRETWGSWDNRTKLLFVIGDIEDEGLKKKIQEEDDLHQDFLQGDFKDTYENLTYKHVMVLKYMVYHCPNAEYLLKVDDDAFVNMPNFVDFIDQYHEKYSNSTDILCNCLLSANVMRKGKWAVSRQYYPNKTYPPYCLGYSIIYPGQTAKLLYQAAQTHPYYWIDDVHVTGIVAHSIDIRHKSTSPLVISGSNYDAIIKKKYNGELVPFIFGFIEISPANMRTLWDYVLKHVPKTSIVDYIS